MWKITFFLIFILTTTLYSQEIFEGLKLEGKEPIVISANELSFNSSEKLAIYKGNVVAQRKDVKIYSDEVRIYFDEKNKIKKIIALGNVKIIDKKGRFALSNVATYYVDAEKIVLSGDAKIQQDSNALESEEIVFYLKNKKVEATGSVKTIIFPKKKKKNASSL